MTRYQTTTDYCEFTFQDIQEGVFEGVQAVEVENGYYMQLTFDNYLMMSSYYKDVKYFDYDEDIENGLIEKIK